MGLLLDIGFWALIVAIMGLGLWGWACAMLDQPTPRKRS